MEVVSAVASIAGIAGFAGQAIGGLSKLSNFFEDCRNVSKTADRFLRDVSALGKALKDVETFLAQAQTLSGAFHSTDLASLNINVEDCSKDVQRWVKEAEGLVFSLGSSKSWFKKFLAAVRKQSIRDIFDEIGNHRSSIMLSLSATGRVLDAYNCSQADVLVSKVGEATGYGKVTVEALSRLETMMETPKTYEIDALNTSRSLSSIASAVSRIESLVSQQFRPSSPARLSSPAYSNPFIGSVPSQPSSPKIISSVQKRKARFDVPVERNLQNIDDLIANATDPEKVKELKQQKRLLRNRQAALDSRARRRIRVEQQKEEVKRLTLEKEELLRDRETLVSNSIENTTLKSGLSELNKLSKQRPQDVPSGLAKYIKQSLHVQSQRSYIHMLSTLLDNLDSPSLELETLYGKVKDQIGADINQLVACRRELWDSGHDPERIDQLINNQSDGKWKETADWVSLDSYPPPEGQQKPWWNVLHHTSSRHWVTKTDRINSWLLQNLAALPEERNRHKALLPNGDELSDEQWARVVLKFWPLDEAAPKFELRTCSTNGAVDSAGACHSVKVLLSALPFNEEDDQVMLDILPIRSRRGEDSEDGSRVLEMARVAKRKRSESDVEVS
ncbi:hypothetical protein BGZ60DRAFT_415138 [Tricladium varicosporioides]|nr:hypothetical protein BGZ60DRAFT_415138 [Hymenoscyphus varicosporioides]